MTATVLICTYNRIEILPACLERVLEAARPHPWVRAVRVIDNCSTDGTAERVRALLSQYPKLHYHYEARPGLSHARNRGAAESTTDYLCYLDDDACPRDGYFERAHALLSSAPYAAIGGMYYPWYPFGKPRWLPANFATRVSMRPDPGPVDLPYLSGNNLWIERAALARAGGFDAGFGPQGKRVGYADETNTLQRLLDAGERLGFDPDMAIDHAVVQRKMRPEWIFEQAYAQGRDGDRYRFETLPQALGGWAKSALGTLVRHLPKAMYRWRKPDYYWQNALLDTWKPIVHRCGRVAGALRRKRGGAW